MKLENYLKKYYKKTSKTEHAKIVSMFSIKILDEIIKNKEYGYLQEYKECLKTASYLHDILSGIEENHAKQGAKLILENKIDGYTDTEHNIIYCAIRYHNGKKPKKKHKIYGSCEKPIKKIIKALSSILQIADLLDYFHLSYVEKIDIKYDIENSVFLIETKPSISKLKDFDIEKDKKRILFKKVFKVQLDII